MTRIAILAAAILAALAFGDLRERTGRALHAAGADRAAALVLGGAVWDGAALYAGGRYAEAADAFRQANFPGQLYDVGLALARDGRLAEAVKAFDSALERDPNDEDARYNLALIESMLAKRRAEGRDANNPANASASQNKRGGEAPSDAENEVNSTGEGAAGDRDSGREATSAGPSKVFRSGRAEQSDRPQETKKATGSIGSSQSGAGRTGDAQMNVARPPEQLAHRLDPMMVKTVAASRRWLETLPDDPGVYVRRRLAHERAGRAERGMAAPSNMDPW
ncbi:tetratricopeptide repeat protein [Hansschlegelia sp. KR7-227]|uniref:tetratricopeptide repeat protein n=1 Tax=Hansschlegelia sp. KR7-227 TaxID=3400914 RepID=UPI003C09F150